MFIFFIPSQAPGILLHSLLEVLNRGATGTSGSGRGDGIAGGSSISGDSRRGMSSERCPAGVVEDLLAMMEQLGQVRVLCFTNVQGMGVGGWEFLT